MLAAALLALWMGPVPFLSWGRAPAPDLAVLKGHQVKISRRLGWYGFRVSQWSVHTLRCPLLRDHLVVKLLTSDANRLVSEVVLIVPRSGDAASALIPVQASGYGDPRAALDLHNVAIFNALVSDEPTPHPRSDADWIELAELYLNLIGEQPQIITSERRSLAPRTAPPQVTPRAGGGAVVEFTDYEGAQSKVAWHFEFDAGARLRGLRRTAAP